MDARQNPTIGKTLILDGKNGSSGRLPSFHSAVSPELFLVLLFRLLFPLSCLLSHLHPEITFVKLIFILFFFFFFF